MAFFFACCAAAPAATSVHDLDAEEELSSIAVDVYSSANEDKQTDHGEVNELITKPKVLSHDSDDAQSLAATEPGHSLGCSDFGESSSSGGDTINAISFIPEPARIASVEPIANVAQADWWSEAELSNMRGMHDATHITKLVEARVVKHAVDQRSLDTWLLEESKNVGGELHQGAPGKDLVTVWLNVGASSLLLCCEVINKNRLRACLENDPLSKRLKLVLNPVQVKLPFPAKGPKDAETVGSFFGKSAQLHCCKGCGGEEFVNLRIDLYSKWLLKLALQKVGFRIGNVVELLVVDWAGPNEKPGVLAACRLSVTDEYMNLLA